MATYSTDLRDVTTTDDSTNWSELNGHTGGAAPATEADYYIQGAACVSQALGTKTGTSAGLEYDNGAAVTFNTGELFFFWQVLLAGNAISDWATGATGFGMQLGIGSSSGNINFWKSQGANVGRNPYGGWNNIAIDPTFTPDNVEGSPVGGSYQVFGSMPNLVSQVSKGSMHGCDKIRVGRGEIKAIAASALFSELAAANDASTARWGLFQAVAGGYLWKGLLSVGDAGNTVSFIDANANIILDNCPRTNASFNRIEINNTGSTVDWTSVSISAPPAADVFPSEGTILSKGQFEVIDNATVALKSCTFTDMDTFIFQSNSTLTSTTFRRCGQVTQGGSTITGGTFDSSTAVSSVLASNLNTITGCTFNSDGSNHAVDLGTVAGGSSFIWNNQESGYVAGTALGNDGVADTGNETIIVNSTGLVTINVTDGASIPSVAITGGGSVDVSAGQKTFTFTLSPSVTSYEWRIYTLTVAGDFETGTEVSGEETATIDNQSLTHSFANQPIAVQIIPNDQGYEEKIEYYTLTASNLDVTINLTLDINA